MVNYVVNIEYSNGALHISIDPRMEESDYTERARVLNAAKFLVGCMMHDIMRGRDVPAFMGLYISDEGALTITEREG